MKNNYIFQNNKTREKSEMLYIFANLIRVWLNRNSWILISSAFNLLQYAISVEVYEENLASQRYIIGKGKVF